MTESVVLKFRATKRLRRSVKAMASELCRRGLMDSESMSQYIKQAVKEKLEADGVVVEQGSQELEM